MVLREEASPRDDDPGELIREVLGGRLVGEMEEKAHREDGGEI
jgi:hypothetical protein